MKGFKITLYKVKKTFKEEGFCSVVEKVNNKILLKKNKLKEKYRKKDVMFKNTFSLPDTKNSGNAMFTIVSKNYLHYALTVRESFLKHNKDTDFYIFLMDKLSSKKDIEMFKKLNDYKVKIIGFEEIKNGIQSQLIDSMLFKYTVLEMNTGLKPFAMEYLLNLGFDKVIYIDPDICFYQKISKIINKLEEYDILLTPHMLKPYSDNKSPSELDIMRAGIYNLGFIAVKNTNNVRRFVHWWQERLAEYGYSDIANGMFTDQKWMDYTPSLFNNVYIFKDPGHNVAYWNLHERNIELSEGVWYVNGQPLVFFHYSGLPLHNITSISKHQNRFNIDDIENVKTLILEYIDLVKSFAPDNFGNMEYYYGHICGTKYKYPDFVRKLNQSLDHPYLPCRDNFNKIIQFLKTPVYGNISNFEKELWNMRKDLQEVFPNIKSDKESQIKFKNWIANDYPKAKEIEQIGNLSYEESLLGLNVIGYHSSIMGVAEAGRLFMQKSAYSSVPLSLFNINSEYHAQLDENELSKYSSSFAVDPIFPKNIFFINADQINNIYEYFPHLFENKYNSALWWWEFDDYFYFKDSFKYLDEVVVFTDFVKSAIEKAAPSNIKLTKMTYPFIKNWNILQSPEEVKKQLGLNADDFLFIYAFDMFSCFERKNPIALVKAFSKAFRGRKDVKLILKITHTDNFPKESKELMELIENENIGEQVTCMESFLSRDELMTLINSSDCYISLHRSEGFGLGMLEAMSLGKPVIATNYGGNLEFMNSNNSLLVDYELVPLPNDFGPYKKGWLWADPDVNHASILMQKLVSDSEFTKEIGDKALSSVKEQFNNEVFSNELYEFLLNNHRSD